ncbi:MAG: translation elongation factor Ts [bacterium]|nr:translation elongation factor Ts [bacterium]
MPISANAVKELREKTGAGMMDCKAALEATNGDFEAAVDWLRKKGISSAAKKAGRSTSDGLISIEIYQNGTRAVLLEINCETDFVAKTEDFKEFIKFTSQLIANLSELPNSVDQLPLEVENKRAATVGKLGENIVIKRFDCLDVGQNARFHSYIHPGGKLGVLVEVSSKQKETLDKPEFLNVCQDLALQIAAASPISISRDTLPQSIIQHELEIAKEQARSTGKPENVIDKIALGKMEKVYSELCLLEQEFVKEPKIRVQDYIHSIEKELKDEVQVRRFIRYKLGE